MIRIPENKGPFMMKFLLLASLFTSTFATAGTLTLKCQNGNGRPWFTMETNQKQFSGVSGREFEYVGGDGLRRVGIQVATNSKEIKIDFSYAEYITLDAIGDLKAGQSKEVNGGYYSDTYAGKVLLKGVYCEATRSK